MGRDFFKTDDIPIRILRREPQPVYPIHTHDFSELVLVLYGRGIHYTDKHSFEVGRGDLFVINGDLGHGYRELDDLVLINILFDLEKLNLPGFDISVSPGYHTLFTVEPLLRGDSRFSSRLKLSESQICETETLIKQMESEISGADEGYAFLTISLFMQLIARISRFYSQKPLQEQSGLYNLGETISYIERNYDRTIKVAELLKISNMSESSLQRAFRKITGTSAIDYQLKKRLEKACILLRNTDLPVTRIAYDTGFSDSNYFSRIFKKTKGETPGEFRKRFRV